MAKKFSELVAKMSPESRARADAETRRMLAEMPLDISELRSQIEAMGGRLEIIAHWPDGSTNTFDPAKYSRIQ
jgi:hypothetical protein